MFVEIVNQVAIKALTFKTPYDPPLEDCKYLIDGYDGDQFLFYPFNGGYILEREYMEFCPEEGKREPQVEFLFVEAHVVDHLVNSGKVEIEIDPYK